MNVTLAETKIGYYFSNKTSGHKSIVHTIDNKRVDNDLTKGQIDQLSLRVAVDYAASGRDKGGSHDDDGSEKLKRPELIARISSCGESLAQVLRLP